MTIEDARADCEAAEFEASLLLRRIVARGHLTPALLKEAQATVRKLRSAESKLYRAAHAKQRTGTDQ